MISRINRWPEAHRGVLFVVMAHLIWGAMAPYFGLIRHIPAYEIAANRGLWSLPLAALVITWLGQWGDVWKVFRNPKHLAILMLTGFIILFNWGFYIWSTQVGRALESSLGYFINPLMNVLVGYVFLGERFNRYQIIAIALAIVGVIVQTVATGVFPWLGLMLAASFCLYGLIRKTVPVGATQGFMVEVIVIFIPVLLLQGYLINIGTAHFAANTFDTFMLMGCGAFTAGGLLFFSAGIRRIRYSTSGILQYISPSLIFITAVTMFGEPLGIWKLLSFVLIWIALAIYSWSSFREER